MDRGFFMPDTGVSHLKNQQIQPSSGIPKEAFRKSKQYHRLIPIRISKLVLIIPIWQSLHQWTDYFPLIPVLWRSPGQ